MLDSVKIARRQSEIRQSLAELVGKETPTEGQVRGLLDKRDGFCGAEACVGALIWA